MPSSPPTRTAPFAAAFLAAALLAAAPPAKAALVISTGATGNVSCANAACTATAKNAVLNVNYLTALLAAGNLTIASGIAQDIRVAAPFSWPQANLLTLDAARAVSIERRVAVQGSGGLVVITNDGGVDGRLSFGAKGRVAFANLTAALTIDGRNYQLEANIAALAAAIAQNPAGNFALANNYDAGPDGTYAAPPIPTRFTGAFEGLGNTISNLAIDVEDGTNTGLFADAAGQLADIILTNADVTGRSAQVSAPTGILAGLNEGTITGAATSGSVTGSAGNNAFVGGLAGASTGIIAWSRSAANVTSGDSGFSGGLVGYAQSGTISASQASGAVSGGQGSMAGGLVGSNAGEISLSFSTGAVESATESKTGGLVGFDTGPISDSYATGSATQANARGYAGGLIGFYQPDGTNIVTRSYSTGAVSGGNETGGFVGFDNSSGTNLAFNYWNRTTSGIENRDQGAGFPAKDPGIEGLTSRALRKHLPHEFHRSIWAQDSGINQGFPYLKANPPGD